MSTKQEVAIQPMGEKTGATVILPAPTAAEQSHLMMATLKEIAMAPDAAQKVEVMRAIMEMNRQLSQDQAERSFNFAMQQAQAEIQKVAKNAKSDKHSYANLEAIDNAIRPVYTKHGFALSYDSESIDANHVRVFCHVSHVDGFSKTYKLDGALDMVGAKGVANKTEIQGMGSAVSYLRRYLACMIFNIVIKGEDNDAESAEIISTEIAVDIDRRARALGDDYHARFLKWTGAESIEKIKARDHKKVITALETAERQKKAEGKKGAA